MPFFIGRHFFVYNAKTLRGYNEGYVFVFPCVKIHSVGFSELNKSLIKSTSYDTCFFNTMRMRSWLLVVSRYSNVGLIQL